MTPDERQQRLQAILDEHDQIAGRMLGGEPWRPPAP
jgi:hypothetical protein